MTLKQACFLADSFRDYCVRYNHMPVFFPAYEKCKAVKAIRENPAAFTGLVDAVINQIITEKRDDPDYNLAFDTLCEIRALCADPAAISYYLEPDGLYKSVHDYALAMDAYRKSKRA